MPIPGQTMMIKIIEAQYLGDFQLGLRFSSGFEEIFDGHLLLQRQGLLLESLCGEDYFRRFFIDAGALCWPNGLELSPVRLHETCRVMVAA